ncbi:MAG: hypothetical protein QW203_03475 [Thermoplasmatales archaeon]
MTGVIDEDIYNDPQQLKIRCKLLEDENKGLKNILKVLEEKNDTLQNELDKLKQENETLWNIIQELQDVAQFLNKYKGDVK